MVSITRLYNFYGNPMEGLEWFSMFIPTLYMNNCMFPDLEKISHLKTLLTSEAKSAVLLMS